MNWMPISLFFIFGLSIGFGAGFIGLNPQINQLYSELDNLESYSDELEITRRSIMDLNSEIMNLKSVITLKNLTINSLNEDIEDNSLLIITLQNEVDELESYRKYKLLYDEERAKHNDAVIRYDDKINTLDIEIMQLKTQLADKNESLLSLQEPILKLIGFSTTQIHNPDGDDKHIVEVWVINYGLDSADWATLKIEFFEGPCPCQAELISTQIITLRDIPAQSAVKIKESYQFELNEEVGKIVEQEFNWG